MSTFNMGGRVTLIKDTEQINDTFQKREFVIESHEQYPQEVKFEVVQDKCSTLDNYSVGDEVNVSFNIRGSKWDSPKKGTMYFVNLSAWNIQKINSNSDGGQTMPPEPEMPDDMGDEDLPF